MACARSPEATIDPGLLNRNIVLQNSVIFGSVNANRHHYELAAKALAQADPGWLADLITRQVPLDQWSDAYTRRPDDIKTILGFRQHQDCHQRAPRVHQEHEGA